MSSTPKHSHLQTPRGSGGMKTPSIAQASSAIRNVDKRKRATFKSSLDSPFDIRWPFVPAQEQAEVLEVLLGLFAPVGEYRRSQLQIASSKKRLNNSETNSTPTPTPKKRKLPSSTTFIPEPVVKPKLMDDIVFGIKEITKCMGLAANSSLKHKDVKKNKPKNGLRMVFVCKADISPSILVNHLLLLAAQTGILIFPLGKNAEQALALTMGVTRVSAIGIKEDTPIFDEIFSVASSKVPVIEANWLTHKVKS